MPIETKVEGSPGAVASVATFLNSTAKIQAESSADDVIDARKISSGAWDGDAGDAYREVANKVAKATDEQSDIAKRAGSVIEDYSGRLARILERMWERRAQATEGGLTVTGTIIADPPTPQRPQDLPAGSTPDEQRAWDAENAAFEAANAKVDLYNKINTEVGDDWARFEQWIEAELGKFAKSSADTTLADTVAGIIKKLPMAEVAFVNDIYAGIYKQYSDDARALAAKLRADAEKAKKLRRSGNPAKQSEGNKMEDPHKARRGARLLEEFAEWAGKLGKRIPIIGYGLGFATDGLAIANGESPGKVLTSSAAGLVGGIVGGALVVAAGSALGVGGLPAIAVAGGAMVVGVGASALAEYGWNNWVPDETKEAIDNGLRDFGRGVGDAWNAATPWN